jgi:hypothetical protein
MDVIRNFAIEAPKAPEFINEGDHDQFWSLRASNQHFEVALSFDGSRECASVAVTSFKAPSMQFPPAP